MRACAARRWNKRFPSILFLPRRTVDRDVGGRRHMEKIWNTTPTAKLLDECYGYWRSTSSRFITWIVKLLHFLPVRIHRKKPACTWWMLQWVLCKAICDSCKVVIINSTQQRMIHVEHDDTFFGSIPFNRFLERMPLVTR